MSGTSVSINGSEIICKKGGGTLTLTGGRITGLDNASSNLSSALDISDAASIGYV